jgi:mono/diheme cytochrome c family protein
MRRLVLLAAWLLLAPACRRPEPVRAGPEPVLTFTRDGAEVARLGRTQLEALVPAGEVAGFDPYYGREKRWRAIPLGPLLARVFHDEGLAGVDFVLRAADGYTVPMTGARLLEPGGHLAVADADGPWEPIGPRKSDPAPFYVVWSGEGQQSLDTHPRPWALAAIAIEPFERVFPKVVPPASGDARVARGFELWRALCIRCHAINQQGGKVGPELNVPRNVTEYREAAFLKDWIRHPQAYRPSAMPAFASLPEEDLDALLAYLAAMKDAKDPALVTPSGGVH